jgi:hypothetical protein
MELSQRGFLFLLITLVLSSGTFLGWNLLKLQSEIYRMKQQTPTTAPAATPTETPAVPVASVAPPAIRLGSPSGRLLVPPPPF